MQHLNQNVFGTPSSPGNVATTAGAKSETLFISFAAPTLPTRLTQEMQDGLSSLSQAFTDLGTSLETFGALATPLPLIGSSQPNDPAATIGNLLDIGSLLQQDIATRINNYFAGDATPTSPELLAALGGAGSPLSNLSLVTDSHDRTEFRFLYSQTRQVSRPLDFGTALADNGVLLDATAQINLVATISLDATFGVDLSRGMSPQQASFLRVHKFDVSAAANLSGLNLGGRIGFLGAALPTARCNWRPMRESELVRVTNCRWGNGFRRRSRTSCNSPGRWEQVRPAGHSRRRCQFKPASAAFRRPR